MPSSSLAGPPPTTPGWSNPTGRPCSTGAPCLRLLCSLEQGSLVHSLTNRNLGQLPQEPALEAALPELLHDPTILYGLCDLKAESAHLPLLLVHGKHPRAETVHVMEIEIRIVVCSGMYCRNIVQSDTGWQKDVIPSMCHRTHLKQTKSGRFQPCLSAISERNRNSGSDCHFSPKS